MLRAKRFNEMEFAIPAANGPACMHELRELMRGRHAGIAWPVEYRTVAADAIPLSPAYGRPTVTISVHQAAQLPHQAFFADVEAIFRITAGVRTGARCTRTPLASSPAATPSGIGSTSSVAASTRAVDS